MELQTLNIGAGKDIRTDAVNVDKVALEGIDIVHDCDNLPLPFKDSQFSKVICNHFLEHCTSSLKMMEEIYRITKNGALIEIELPLAPCMEAFVDPTHKQFFTFLSFNYYSPDHPDINFYTHARFKTIKRKLLFQHKLFTWFFNSHSLLQKIHAVYLYNLIPAGVMQIELATIK